MLEKEVNVVNKAGIHARPSTKIAEVCNKYKSSVKFKIQGSHGLEIDAKSVISLLTMGALKGTKIIIKANGEDEKEVIDELFELIEVKGFDEEI